METDGEGDDGEGTWSRVVSRGRKERMRPRGPQVVVEPPEKVEHGEARNELMSCLNPKDGVIRVRGIRKYRNNFIVEVHDTEDLEILKTNPSLGKSGFKIDGEPTMRRPRLLFYDVDREMREPDIYRALRNRNKDLIEGLTEEDMEKEIEAKFRTGPRDGKTVNWVVEVSPRVYGRIMAKGRVYIGLRSCRVKEYLGITRCYKCQGFGHIGRYCTRKPVCSRCGSDGHLVGRCREDPDRPKCINCRRAGMRDDKHGVGWAGCPAYQMFQRRLASRTQYK